MKKMVLLCAAVLACGGLAGCGQYKDNSSAKISSLKAENSSLKAKKSSSHKAKHHRNSSSQNEVAVVLIAKWLLALNRQAAPSKATPIMLFMIKMAELFTPMGHVVPFHPLIKKEHQNMTSGTPV